MSEEKIKPKSCEIQRIYIKDVSFEAPNTPKIFHKNWKPNLKFNLDTICNELKKNIFEIVIKVRVTVKIDEDLVFLCEVHQAGIFFITNLNTKELKHCLYSYCPNILFPYARACISSLVSSASFPQLNLAPINFDVIYFNHFNMTKK